MTTLPLGYGAYKRAAGGFPEVKLINRFLESAPTNLKEKVALIARPGTNLLERFPPDTDTGRIRGVYSEAGTFNGDLFVVSGQNLYRYDGSVRTLIGGEIKGDGRPSVAFDKGAGYERLFIADGVLLNYYGGGTHATAVLTDDGSATYTGAVIAIGGVYYGWTEGDVDDGPPDGTSGAPFLCRTGSGAAEALSNMAAMLNFDGTPGTDFSSTLSGPNTLVTAEANTDDGTLTLTARVETAAGNNITVSVSGDEHLSWDGATLSGGGSHSLHGIPMPGGLPAKLCASLNHYIWIGVADSQRFYWIKPGETSIDPLLFAEAESSPDPVHGLERVGDTMVVLGAASTEFWAATGDANIPFAPIQGRTLSRGVVEGTAVAVDERTIILVGDDGKVYAISGAPQRISDHSIEERIRRQLRREAGLR